MYPYDNASPEQRLKMVQDMLFGFDKRPGVQGWDAQNATPAGAPPMFPSGQFSNLSVTLLCAQGDALDQEVFSTDDESAPTLPEQIISPDVTAYENMIKYFSKNPSQLLGFRISSSEPNGQATLLASMQVIPLRSTPFNASAQNAQPIDLGIGPGSYNTNIVYQYLPENIDTFSRLKFTTDVNDGNADRTFKVTFLFGDRQELRSRLPQVAPGLAFDQFGRFIMAPPAGLGAAPAGAGGFAHVNLKRNPQS